MAISFKDLLVGAKFHQGISNGIGICSAIKKYVVFQKNSSSHAVVVDMVGFGPRKPLVGDCVRIGGYSLVYAIGE